MHQATKEVLQIAMFWCFATVSTQYKVQRGTQHSATLGRGRSQRLQRSEGGGFMLGSGELTPRRRKG